MRDDRQCRTLADRCAAKIAELRRLEQAFSGGGGGGDETTEGHGDNHGEDATTAALALIEPYQFHVGVWKATKPVSSRRRAAAAAAAGTHTLVLFCPRTRTHRCVNVNIVCECQHCASSHVYFSACIRARTLVCTHSTLLVKPPQCTLTCSMHPNPRTRIPAPSPSLPPSG